MVLDAPAPTARQQAVKFPTAAVARIQLAGKVAEQDDATPTLELTNDDTLVGTLNGKLELATAFDTIAVNAARDQVARPRSATAPPDVSVTLWDGTSLSGQVPGPGAERLAQQRRGDEACRWRWW